MGYPDLQMVFIIDLKASILLDWSDGTPAVPVKDAIVYG
jgi:hypothetical protein